MPKLRIKPTGWVRTHIFQLLSGVLLILFLAMLVLYLRTKSAPVSVIGATTLKEIGKLILLPTGSPEMTTVNDVAEAKRFNPAFYQNVNPGDTLLTYSTLAILYNPHRKMIVGIQTFPPAPPPPPSTPLRIALRYNGDEEPRALVLKTQLTRASDHFQIVEVAKSTAIYREDVVYVINKTRKEDITNLAQTIGGSRVVEETAEGENPTQADVIVAFRAIP